MLDDPVNRSLAIDLVELLADLRRHEWTGAWGFVAGREDNGGRQAKANGGVGTRRGTWREPRRRRVGEKWGGCNGSARAWGLVAGREDSGSRRAEANEGVDMRRGTWRELERR